jgi:hypothetical protein
MLAVAVAVQFLPLHQEALGVVALVVLEPLELLVVRTLVVVAAVAVSTKTAAQAVQAS